MSKHAELIDAFQRLASFIMTKPGYSANEPQIKKSWDVVISAIEGHSCSDTTIPAESQPDELLVFDEYCDASGRGALWFDCPFLLNGGCINYGGKLQYKMVARLESANVRRCYRCAACKAKYKGGLQLVGVK